MTKRAQRTWPVAVRTIGRGTVAVGERLEALTIDHRAAVGGSWEEIGPLQLNFLQEKGLKPSDRLLDIGCGSLRGGVRFVAYLDPGNYYGLDISQDLIDAGRQELAAAGLDTRGAHLVVDDSFSFERLGTGFDFALAQSVFTHLSLNSIHRCLVKVSEALRPGGRLYATFFEQEGGRHDLDTIEWPTRDGRIVTTWPDRDPFHYRPEVIGQLCEGLPLEFNYIGEWDHPRRQRMLEFTRAAQPAGVPASGNDARASS